jgi:hypothetical protein
MMYGLAHCALLDTSHYTRSELGMKMNNRSNLMLASCTRSLKLNLARWCVGASKIQPHVRWSLYSAAIGNGSLEPDKLYLGMLHKQLTGRTL